MPWQNKFGALLIATLMTTGSLSVDAVRPPPAQAQAAAPTSFTGQARVVDGDTLYIGQEKFRLYGVDAPEKAQSCVNPAGQQYGCGLISKDALTQKVGTKVVECKVKNRDQYGRAVAICSLVPTLPGQQPEDLNKWLVDNGLAVAYREYGKDYIPAEEAAKAARKGIWAGTFEYPAKWRKEAKAGGPNPPLSPTAPMPPPSPSASAPPKPAPAPVPNVCGSGVQPIKGNIGSKGDKIYHVPGSRYYDSTVIEVDQGEKYFCNEQEAQAAGWRAAGGGAGK